MYRLRIAILDSNENYLKRLVNTLNIKYQSKMDFISFSTIELLNAFQKTEKLDAILIDEKTNKDINMSLLNCSIGFLVDSEDISLINGVKAISRYQNVELIYKFILELVSDKKQDEVKSTNSQITKTKIFTFLSGGSGAGGSTISAAFCYAIAQKGSKVLFLNLDPFGTPTVFFNSEGNQCLSDLIVSIKNKRGNFQFKLESSVKCDSGVFFLDETTSPLDLYELNSSDLSILISEICYSNQFDYIVIDGNLLIPNSFQSIATLSHRIILISKGTWISNFKVSKLIHMINTISAREKIDISSKVHILYNQFSTGISRKLEMEEARNNFGVISMFKCHSSNELARYLSITKEIKSIVECDT
ncbi:MAG: CobQ/CobB/MinD/ParA nucleotide binding protein [Bacillales bacterium]|jgi:cellulose biosynthesis protein BcsQ|nr:CobQ/CobB/MinD/ParA nucleotide binding protein [Bacillales bacterium]